MIKKDTILKVAHFRQQEKRLKAKIDALRDKLNVDQRLFTSWSGWDDGSIGLHLKPADYLAHWPDAKETVKSYTSSLDGKLHVWSEWPWQYVGEGLDGTKVWAKGETDSQVLEGAMASPLPTPAPVTAAAESAASPGEAVAA